MIELVRFRHRYFTGWGHGFVLLARCALVGFRGIDVRLRSVTRSQHLYKSISGPMMEIGMQPPDRDPRSTGQCHPKSFRICSFLGLPGSGIGSKRSASLSASSIGLSFIFRTKDGIYGCVFLLGLFFFRTNENCINALIRVIRFGNTSLDIGDL